MYVCMYICIYVCMYVCMFGLKPTLGCIHGANVYVCLYSCIRDMIPMHGNNKYVRVCRFRVWDIRMESRWIEESVQLASYRFALQDAETFNKIGVFHHCNNETTAQQAYKYRLERNNPRFVKPQRNKHRAVNPQRNNHWFSDRRGLSVISA